MKIPQIQWKCRGEKCEHRAFQNLSFAYSLEAHFKNTNFYNFVTTFSDLHIMRLMLTRRKKKIQPAIFFTRCKACSREFLLFPFPLPPSSVTESSDSFFSFLSFSEHLSSNSIAVECSTGGIWEEGKPRNRAVSYLRTTVLRKFSELILWLRGKYILQNVG